MSLQLPHVRSASLSPLKWDDRRMEQQEEEEEEARQHLHEPCFDHWAFTGKPECLIEFIVEMFIQLDLIESLSIDKARLYDFLWTVHANYNPNPFHNFMHCFAVCQLAYSLIRNHPQLNNHLTPLEKLILLFSALCHDLDHPGLNNLYQIHAQTSLAFIYNDTSVLENYHCAMAFAVLKQTDFLSHLSNTQRLAFRQGVIQCIQATDIAKQPQVLRSFTALTPRFQWKDPTHRQELLVMLMKAADIGNETRGLAVSERWADCLMQEFKAQVDLERQQGLSVASFMDPEHVSKAQSQFNFLTSTLLPLYEALSPLLPQLEQVYICPIRDALVYYQQLLG